MGQVEGLTFRAVSAEKARDEANAREKELQRELKQKEKVEKRLKKQYRDVVEQNTNLSKELLKAAQSE